MKARLKKDAEHMLLAEEMQKGAILDVEHYAYGRFYRILYPLDYSGMTIEKDMIEFLDEEVTT